MDLRERHSSYFSLSANASPAENFWEANPILLDSVYAYVRDIVAKTPRAPSVKTGSHFLTSLALYLPAKGVVAVANQFGAGIVWNGIEVPVLWLAKHAVPPVKRFVVNRLAPYIAEFAEKAVARKRTDLLFGILDVPSDLRSDCRS